MNNEEFGGDLDILQQELEEFIVNSFQYYSKERNNFNQLEHIMRSFPNMSLVRRLRQYVEDIIKKSYRDWLKKNYYADNKKIPTIPSVEMLLGYLKEHGSIGNDKKSLQKQIEKASVGLLSMNLDVFTVMSSPASSSTTSVTDRILSPISTEELLPFELLGKIHRYFLRSQASRFQALKILNQFSCEDIVYADNWAEIRNGMRICLEDIPFSLNAGKTPAKTANTANNVNYVESGNGKVINPMALEALKLHSFIFHAAPVKAGGDVLENLLSDLMNICERWRKSLDSSGGCSKRKRVLKTQILFFMHDELTLRKVRLLVALLRQSAQYWIYFLPSVLKTVIMSTLKVLSTYYFIDKKKCRLAFSFSVGIRLFSLLDPKAKWFRSWFLLGLMRKLVVECIISSGFGKILVDDIFSLSMQFTNLLVEESQSQSQSQSAENTSRMFLSLGRVFLHQLSIVSCLLSHKDGLLVFKNIGGQRSDHVDLMGQLIETIANMTTNADVNIGVENYCDLCEVEIILLAILDFVKTVLKSKIWHTDGFRSLISLLISCIKVISECLHDLFDGRFILETGIVQKLLFSIIEDAFVIFNSSKIENEKDFASKILEGFFWAFQCQFKRLPRFFDENKDKDILLFVHNLLTRYEKIYSYENVPIFSFMSVFHLFSSFMISSRAIDIILQQEGEEAVIGCLLYVMNCIRKSELCKEYEEEFMDIGFDEKKSIALSGFFYTSKGIKLVGSNPFLLTESLKDIFKLMNLSSLPSSGGKKLPCLFLSQLLMIVPPIIRNNLTKYYLDVINAFYPFFKNQKRENVGMFVVNNYYGRHFVLDDSKMSELYLSLFKIISSSALFLLSCTEMHEKYVFSFISTALNPQSRYSFCQCEDTQIHMLRNIMVALSSLDVTVAWNRLYDLNNMLNNILLESPNDDDDDRGRGLALDHVVILVRGILSRMNFVGGPNERRIPPEDLDDFDMQFASPDKQFESIEHRNVLNVLEEYVVCKKLNSVDEHEQSICNHYLANIERDLNQNQLSFPEVYRKCFLSRDCRKSFMSNRALSSLLIKNIISHFSRKNISGVDDFERKMSRNNFQGENTAFFSSIVYSYANRISNRFFETDVLRTLHGNTWESELLETIVVVWDSLSGSFNKKSMHCDWFISTIFICFWINHSKGEISANALTLRSGLCSLVGYLNNFDHLLLKYLMPVSMNEDCNDNQLLSLINDVEKILEHDHPDILCFLSFNGLSLGCLIHHYLRQLFWNYFDFDQICWILVFSFVFGSVILVHIIVSLFVHTFKSMRVLHSIDNLTDFMYLGIGAESTSSQVFDVLASLFEYLEENYECT